MIDYEYTPEFEQALFNAVEGFFSAVNDAVDEHTLAHHHDNEVHQQAVNFMLNHFRRYDVGDDLQEMAHGMIQEYDRHFGEVEEMAIRLSSNGERQTECLSTAERNA